MRTRLMPLIAVLALSLASAQAAEPAAAPPAPGGKELKDKAAAPINEIEHGFYMGVTAGFWSLVNPPAAANFSSELNGTIPGSKRPFSSGQTAQVELGFDFGERLSVGLFVQGTANRVGSDYTGNSQDPRTGLPRASGDFTSIIPGALVRVGLLGFKDSQEVKRAWIYVRVGGGFVLYQPKILLPGSDVLIFAGPGVEYFTRLRHFSIGLEADFIFMALSQSFGFTVTPMLRYAF